MSPGTPSLEDISLAQEQPRNLRRQQAAREFYKNAKKLQVFGSRIGLTIALAAPIVMWLKPDGGPALGAIGGLWIFISRLALKPLQERRRVQGALTQEMFDCDVLGLPWNMALGRPIAEEDVNRAAAREENGDVSNWYPTENNAPWPMSVLICQRSNAVWARRQHRTYGGVLVGFVIIWALVGIVSALVNAATLAQYLVNLALPSLPALLDASEHALDHFKASRERDSVEADIDDALVRDLGRADLRAIQDELFMLRRNAPLVPEWYYKRLRPKFEEDMKYAARQRAEGETV